MPALCHRRGGTPRCGVRLRALLPPFTEEIGTAIGSSETWLELSRQPGMSLCDRVDPCVSVVPLQLLPTLCS